MNRKTFAYLIAFATIFTTFSCSSSSSSDELPENDKETVKFNPKNIVIKKNRGAASSEETWSDIVYDMSGNVKSFEHSFTKNGVLIEKREQSISGVTGDNQMITNIEVFDATGNPTKSLLEIAKLNSSGLITEIKTITTAQKEDDGATLPTITRTFEYNGLQCKRFTYIGSDYEITCEYSWSGYKLSKTTEKVVDLNTGRKETNVYTYTFDSENTYPYEGISMFPFIQSERDNNFIPHIYAAMGLFGITPPYIVKKENQERFITTNSEMGPGFDDKTQLIEKEFYFTKKNSIGEVKYDISSVDKDTNIDLYDNYTITFIE